MLAYCIGTCHFPCQSIVPSALLAAPQMSHAQAEKNASLESLVRATAAATKEAGKLVSRLCAVLATGLVANAKS